MPQVVDLADDTSATMTENNDGDYTQFERRKKKEKRRASRLAESESETTATAEDVPLDKILKKKKKKKKVTKSDASEVSESLSRFSSLVSSPEAFSVFANFCRESI